MLYDNPNFAGQMICTVVWQFCPVTVLLTLCDPESMVVVVGVAVIISISSTLPVPVAVLVKQLKPEVMVLVTRER